MLIWKEVYIISNTLGDVLNFIRKINVVYKKAIEFNP